MLLFYHKKSSKVHRKVNKVMWQMKVFTVVEVFWSSLLFCSNLKLWFWQDYQDYNEKATTFPLSIVPYHLLGMRWCWLWVCPWASPPSSGAGSTSPGPLGSATSTRNYNTVTLWHYDTITLWHYDTITLWYYDTMTLWRYDAMTLWRYDARAPLTTEGNSNCPGGSLQVSRG